MKHPPSKHLKKQNELKKVLQTLSKRKALVLDEQKIFQMLFEQENKHIKQPGIQKNINININPIVNANILYLHGESPKLRANTGLGNSTGT